MCTRPSGDQKALEPHLEPDLEPTTGSEGSSLLHLMIDVLTSVQRVCLTMLSTNYPRSAVQNHRRTSPRTWAGQNVALLVFQGWAQARHSPVLGLGVVANTLPAPNAPAAVAATL